jgi:hypothetical protein
MNEESVFLMCLSISARDTFTTFSTVLLILSNLSNCEICIIESFVIYLSANSVDIYEV